MSNEKTSIATITKVTPKREVLLSNVREAASVAGVSFEALRDAIKAAGTNQDDVRRAVMVGYLAGRLKVSFEESARILDLRASDSQVAADLKRSITQDIIVAAGRKVWSRALADAGVKTSNKKGGARLPNGSKASKPETIKVAKITTQADLRAHLMAVAKHLAGVYLTATQPGGEHSLFAGDYGSVARNAIADFAKAVQTDILD
jgi:hypothetical protein